MVDQWLANVLGALPESTLHTYFKTFIGLLPDDLKACPTGSLCSGINFAGVLVDAFVVKLARSCGRPDVRVEHVFAFEKKPSAQKFIKEYP